MADDNSVVQMRVLNLAKVKVRWWASWWQGEQAVISQGGLDVSVYMNFILSI